MSNVVDMKTGRLVEAPSLPTICANVRHYRMVLGMEQKQLSTLLGVSPNTVCNWENGRGRPDIGLIPDLCRLLKISPYQLFGIEEKAPELNGDEASLIEKYRFLTPGNQYAVRNLVDSLGTVQAAERRRPKLFALPYFEKPLAAGVGDPTEYEGKSETRYLYDCPELTWADCLYSVNGDSMEPEFHDGDMVFVQRASDTVKLAPGEIGAFIVGNELFIKQYEADGLHSLNPRYPVMRFGECDTGVYLLGRVLGVVAPELCASQEDIHYYLVNTAGT